ncbi:MAG TPA: hypothetical protein VFC41_03815 [Anaerovoracaceae bacterium]|nr:hypothetical protein [Anaerovoracaceae bacterium]
MTDRSKTTLILSPTKLIMFSPLAMSLFWHPIPLFQNLGFDRESIAPSVVWILAAITAVAYVLCTMKAISLVFGVKKVYLHRNNYSRSGEFDGSFNRDCNYYKNDMIREIPNNGISY